VPGPYVLVGHSLGGALPERSPISAADIDAINAAQWNGQAAWADSVPGAKVVTVPDTTHYVQNQRPDAVVAATREAMTRGRAQRADGRRCELR
jgi:hypothetical protein